MKHVFERHWMMCSNYVSQHDWGNVYDHLLSARTFSLLLNKSSRVYEVYHAWAQFGFANHVALIACLPTSTLRPHGLFESHI